VLEIRIRIKDETIDVIGFKDAFAYFVEQWGDIMLIDVAEIKPEQMNLFFVGDNHV